MNRSPDFKYKLQSLLIKAGVCTVKVIAAVFLALLKLLKFIASDLLELVKDLGKAGKWLLGSVTESFRERVRVSNKLIRNVKKAKFEDQAAYRDAQLRFLGSFLFGEGGLFYTAFNYILPIVCAAFLVGVVRYGSGLEYGIAVEYNGKEIGIISAEADFEKAEREVQQRISYSDKEEQVDLDAKFSLRIINENDHFVSATQLADEMLAASDESLSNAWGVYIDGSFVGAVRDCEKIKEALMENLLSYQVSFVVKDLDYVNDIEYVEGIFLDSSIMSEDEMIKLLTSTKVKQSVYVVQQGESEVSICLKTGMTFDEFDELNKNVNTIVPGQIVKVLDKESYLPIQYTRELELTSFIDYETIEVETSSLNLGIRSILQKGEPGEKVSKVEITFVDGVERSRKTIESHVTKQPLVQQIGIGTYTAQPDHPDTVWFGSPLTGSGEFGWPVEGGWISDTFISDRNHMGLDIAADQGKCIYAAEEGMVVSAGWNSGGYGNVVMIDHMNGYQTVYGHMCYVEAVEGQYVSKGQLIGFVGSTGDSTGPHCHFEVRYQGVYQNPANYLNTAAPVTTDKKAENTNN